MIYNFEWDPIKAKSNLKKHKVSFENAASVFKDPRALTIFDKKHSADEDRWITLGISNSGLLLVVHHTFKAITNDMTIIRILSSRKAENEETEQYKEE